MALPSAGPTGDIWILVRFVHAAECGERDPLCIHYSGRGYGHIPGAFLAAQGVAVRKGTPCGGRKPLRRGRGAASSGVSGALARCQRLIGNGGEGRFSPESGGLVPIK